VRIKDHHALSSSFQRFCRREAAKEREVYGHWPWIVPPLSAKKAFATLHALRNSIDPELRDAHGAWSRHPTVASKVVA
jgi:nitric oxide synthase oxygenase domain/subunit